jgi:hypothetical protein
MESETTNTARLRRIGQEPAIFIPQRFDLWTASPTGRADRGPILPRTPVGKW